MAQAHLLAFGEINRLDACLRSEQGDIFEPQTVGLLTKLSHIDQVLNRLRSLAIAIVEFGQDCVELSAGGVLAAGR